MNFIKRNAVLIFTLLFFALAVLTTAQPVEPVEEIASINITESFSSLTALAALVVLITAWLKTFIGKFKFVEQWKDKTFLKDWKQYLSWLVALLVSTVGYFFQWGLFVGIAWYYILIYAIVTGLISNGIADWNLLKTILEAFKLIPKKTVNDEQHN